MAKNKITPNSSKTNCQPQVRQVRTSVFVSIIWLVVILLLVIAILASVLISNNLICGNKLLNTIVNFSTILSIIVSITSILFACYTSLQTGNQYSHMAQALEEIRATNGHMAENNQLLLQFVKDMSGEVEKIKVIAENNQVHNAGMINNDKIPSNA